MFLDNVFQHVPDLGPRSLDQPARALYVVRVALFHELLHDERLKEFQSHLFGKAALVKLQVGAHDDNRAARIVHTLSQEVLPEPPLFSLEHIGQRFEGPLAGPCDRPAAAPVIDERVDGFLEHPFFVSHDDVRSAQI